MFQLMEKYQTTSTILGSMFYLSQLLIGVMDFDQIMSISDFIFMLVHFGIALKVAVKKNLTCF